MTIHRYRVGPRFPSTSLFLLVIGEQWLFLISFNFFDFFQRDPTEDLIPFSPNCFHKNNLYNTNIFIFKPRAFKKWPQQCASFYWVTQKHGAVQVLACRFMKNGWFFKQLAWFNSPEIGLHFGKKKHKSSQKPLKLFTFAFGWFFSSCAAQDDFQIAVRYRKINFFTFSDTFSIGSDYENF